MTSPADATTNSGRRQHYGVTFVVLALAGIAFAMLQSAVAPALPQIQDELGASSAATTWLFTGYLLSASVLTPIIGRIGDMFGKEHTLVATLCVLGAGTLLAALAASVELLIAARIIQGAGGAIFPLAFGIIRDEFPPERAAMGIAMVSGLMAIGGGLGIVLAGPIIESFDYHWLFWFPLVAVVISTVLTIFFIPESPVKSPGRIDWLGALLLAGWLVLLLFGITQASEWGWGDARVLGLIGAAVAILALWMRVESAEREPLVDMALMRMRSVWTVNAAAFLVGAGLYSAFLLIPEFVETPPGAGYGFGASVSEAGVFLVPCTVAMLIVSPLGGRLAGRIGSRSVLLAGCLATAAAFAMLAAAHHNAAEIYVATALMGIGIGLSFASLANLIVEVVPPRQTAVATGMNTVMRTLGGSLGGQVGASVIAGSAAGAALPTAGSFTIAFAISSGACLLAALSTLLVPKHSVRMPVGAEPALAAD